MTILGKGVFGCFGHDDLVGFTVDHELPATFVNVLAISVQPDGESPFFEQVD